MDGHGRMNWWCVGYHAKRLGTTLPSPTRWHLTLLASLPARFADRVFPGAANATPRHASARHSSTADGPGR